MSGPQLPQGIATWVDALATPEGAAATEAIAMLRALVSEGTMRNPLAWAIVDAYVRAWFTGWEDQGLDFRDAREKLAAMAVEDFRRSRDGQ